MSMGICKCRWRRLHKYRDRTVLKCIIESVDSISRDEPDCH